ncbi:hypothetical protein BDF14DRAFT_1802630 [Spinellus fusiger]|nr:hypothetical protein BDF14DRAFT_1802630 [Spinellus fusiger]
MAFPPQQVQDMQEILSKGLGPEFLSRRPGPGGHYTYIEGWMAIDLANQIFGFDGWSSEIRSLTVDYLDEVGDQKYNVSVTAQVRVTLKDGTHHEDVGSGSAENVRIKSAALEKARKEAVTDALKRALRLFGRALGNCIYDQGYIKAMAYRGTPKIKANEEVLHRHKQFQTLPEHPITTTTTTTAATTAATNTTKTTTNAPTKIALSINIPHQLTTKISAASVITPPTKTSHSDCHSPLNEDSFNYEYDEDFLAGVDELEAADRLDPELPSITSPALSPSQYAPQHFYQYHKP